MSARLSLRLCLVLSAAGTAARAQGQALPLTRWVVGGGALRIAQHGQYFRLSVPKNADWGNCYVEGQADMGALPYLVAWIVEVGRDAQWQLTVNDPDVHSLQGVSASVGLHVYDLRKSPGWQGQKRFRVYFTVQGRGKYVDVAWIDLFRQPPFQPQTPDSPQTLLRWDRLNNCLATAKDDGLTISLQGAGDQWGGAQIKVTVDTDRFPFLEVDVHDLAPQTRWRVKVGRQQTGPEHRSTGALAFNYRDANNWVGQQEVEVGLVVLGSGRAANFASVRLAAVPSASTELVSKAAKVRPWSATEGAELATGDYRFGYEASLGMFRIQRRGADPSLVTRFIEMPGLDLTPAGGLATEKKRLEGGERLSFRREFDDVSYAVEAEAPAASPGLLHWRVTATAREPIPLRSSGHELCFVPASAEQGQALRRLTSQNMVASALALAVAPGLGSVFYFQNLTALNPLLDLCHTSPRWLVSVGPKTLGFANPLDTSAKLPAGEMLVLSDAWLYLSPTEPTDRQQQAELFLQGLSTVYDHLPDKPDTEFLDWQQLARDLARDLLRPQCWGVFAGKEYLQPYVNTQGAVAQLVPLQDVLAPVLRFAGASDQASLLKAKLRERLPDFWYPTTGTFREYAQPGDHIWYDPTWHASLCRAALAGEDQARDLCLRSADALIRVAHETNHSFQMEGHWSSPNELPGCYLLFMMLCHELSPEQRFLDEAKQAAEQVQTWPFGFTQSIFRAAMTCEGLARLYAATKDEQYVKLSLLPLAEVMGSAWLWECDYGHARSYPTFFGLNPEGWLNDYIAAMEQHQSWYALRQYYRLTHAVLPPYANCLVAEFLRYAPMTIWYAYPPHLPAESLHEGPAFWKTTNVYDAFIPVEDLNEGWRKNGSVGQEIYGAGAAFNVANEAYTRIPAADIVLFCEYPLLKAEWDGERKVLSAQIGGVSHHEAKVEVRFDPTLSGWPQASELRASYADTANPQTTKPLTTAVVGQALRMTVPGESVLTVGPPR